jgi:hypothetical protein
MNDLWLCAAAFLAGAINSVAGGGTLLTFPALVWTLGGSAEATVLANATSTVALFPGSMAGMWGYRRDFVGTERWIRWLLGPSIVGGLLGSLLVIWLPPEWFRQLVPWLILTATLLFLLQPVIARWTGIGLPHQTPTPRLIAGIIFFQFLVAVYGGYFGAGIGILMLSSLALIGVGDIHRMNALKTLLATCINGLSFAVFITAGNIVWRYALPMTAAAIVGGYVGAHTARKLDRNLVRGVVIVIGLTLSAHYFGTIWWSGRSTAGSAYGSITRP